MAGFTELTNTTASFRLSYPLIATVRVEKGMISQGEVATRSRPVISRFPNKHLPAGSSNNPFEFSDATRSTAFLNYSKTAKNKIVNPDIDDTYPSESLYIE